MAIIYKYKVEPKHDVQTIEVVYGARLISAIEQNGEIMVYALTEHDYHKSLGIQSKNIFVVGTGWDFDLGNEFQKNLIGTVKVGTFVWHVLEVDELPF
ncbi:MAG: hypothetical protein K0Q73_5438 [Paenibacillus sp.]|jgi:hypothetical protein|nr:hypothetical protein [Paenibacillus sp.]